MRGIAGSCASLALGRRTIKTRFRQGSSAPAAPRASRGSTLAGLEAALDLVDHVDAAFAADQAIAAMAAAQRFQRVADFHDSGSRAHGRAVSQIRSKVARKVGMRWRLVNTLGWRRCRGARGQAAEA